MILVSSPRKGVTKMGRRHCQNQRCTARTQKGRVCKLCAGGNTPFCHIHLRSTAASPGSRPALTFLTLHYTEEEELEQYQDTLFDLQRECFPGSDPERVWNHFRRVHIVQDKDGHVVAFAYVVSAEVLGGGKGWAKDALVVADVCVDKQERGRGVGSQLIHYLVKRERQEGDTGLLQLKTDNPGAKRIYEKAGFVFARNGLGSLTL